MKIHVFYDVFCEACGRSLSQDYACGLCDSEKTAEKEALRIGFLEIGGKQLCPACGKKLAVRSATEKKDRSLQ